jgi:hypothetical protein
MRATVVAGRRSPVSEQGWWGFLVEEGLEDWVVLHGGATAVFRVASVTAAAQLAQAVAGVTGFDGSPRPSPRLPAAA